MFYDIFKFYILRNVAFYRFATPSGITTIPGVETPDSIELRKRKTESVAGGDTPQALYRVLEEKRVDRLGGQIMGSSHVYDLSVAYLRLLLSRVHENMRVF